MNKEIKLGDYVDYRPEARTSEKYKAFDVDKRKEADKYFSTQTGDKALKWRYMGLDEKGCILLVADRPTDDRLYLYGKDGYVNGPNKLNDLCKELYSSLLGEARSINVDDVNRVLKAKPVGVYYSLNHEFMNNPENLTIGEIISKKGEPALMYTQTPEAGKGINDYVADYYSYSGTTYKEYSTPEYKLIFNGASDTFIYYWLASSCVYVRFDYGHVDFGVRCVSGGCLDYCSEVISDICEVGSGYPVRPVVSLKSRAQFVGKSPEGVWQVG